MIIPAEGQLFLAFLRRLNKNNKLPKSVSNTFWNTKKMALRPKEKDIELAICHLLRAKGIFFWKNVTGGFFDGKLKRFKRQASPYAINGTPDLIAIIDGKFIGFEVKSAKGIQSDSQKEFERRCIKANGKYFLVRSVQDVENALKGILNG